ncbi:MAG: bifunctional phosphoribosylaminoimidazolecarboxamide formyltransferase/IMP cyclohydrolase [Dinghuibacter sp.]|nr:bifunctional phosphoribosylaminoimidazolecarboxamide formyltransferase/IMP cyclohydrolase [Dinghuibacter sp.]
MEKKIQSALISVFYKEGIDTIAQTLHAQGVTIYSTGGTQQFIEALGIPCTGAETVTGYPSILGGRVKTLHPKIFGGILGRRGNEQDVQEMNQYEVPAIDLVIVDLYPFEETLAGTSDEQAIIEKIDIGGPSMIRAAAKNHADVAVVASKNDYALLNEWLTTQNGALTLVQRKQLAAKAFDIVMHYDIAIANYFNPEQPYPVLNPASRKTLRYGENPHQQGVFYGHPEQLFAQLHGKELSYNNLADADAALQLVSEFSFTPEAPAVFAIIKHSNVCGMALAGTVQEAWTNALAGDPESAFGGVLACNQPIDAATAQAIQEIFFEVLMAPGFAPEALELLKAKKNRILLQLNGPLAPGRQFKSLLNGVLVQDADTGSYSQWQEAGGRNTTAEERQSLELANIICKHLKSNAIALVKENRLVGKGCGQTSRIDALRQAIEKAKQNNVDLTGAVMASDAFFPFNDCVQLGYAAGITAFIQPGGSILYKDSIADCVSNNLAMVLTGMRHFKH